MWTREIMSLAADRRREKARSPQGVSTVADVLVVCVCGLACGLLEGS